MDLETYQRKRTFHKTLEPRGEIAPARKKLAYVIQKHAAHRLHYDFRLEMKGVLASWAVPKGPSLNPKDRRLAVQVENHPLEYGTFEGTIPAGQYGAGSVLLWDKGYWIPKGDPVAGWRKGKLKFHLEGKKLHGTWNLIRMTGQNTGEHQKNWLLIKERDKAAKNGDILREKPESVASGRDIEKIGRHDPQWKSNKRYRTKRATSLKQTEQIPGVKKSKLPSFVRPQLATLVDVLPQGDGWLQEIKFDGYRIQCRIKKGRAAFLTREGKDWTTHFRHLVDPVAELPLREALLDGEVVALQEDGTTSFQLLQNSLGQDPTENLVYFVFDILYLNGYDLTKAPLLSRKKILSKIVKPSAHPENHGPVRYSEHWIGQGEALFEKACRLGLEGIMSKKIDQPYRSGRGQDWLKVKCLMSQEFVIGGFTDPFGSRAGLGALLLGVHDNKGNLRYAGRVGSGFSSQTLRDLRSRLNVLVRKSSPFANSFARTDTKGVHWVKPELVGEIAFTGWTEDGLLRHPSFKGLREDKPAGDIKREKAAPVQKPAASSINDSIEISGIKITHPDRILYPEQGITKGEFAHYYEKIAKWIMPHLTGRPLTLVRCPEGSQKHCFYQRHVENSIDESIHRIPIQEERSAASFISVDSLSGLIALVQMGALEFHTWGSTNDRLEQPDHLIFDLDPDAAITWERLREAAQDLRVRLSDLGLGSFVKTTGGKGLHVVVPIIPKQDWEQMKSFSKLVAQSIVREAPDRYTAVMSKSKRKGKIFVDYLRNGRTATAICAYSTRARPGAPVSVPLRWEELKTDVRGDYFTIRNVTDRLAHLRKDPWEDYDGARRIITKSMLKQL